MSDDSRHHDERARSLGHGLHLTFGHLDRKTLADCFEDVFQRPAAGPLWEKFVVVYLAALQSEGSKPSEPDPETARSCDTPIAVMTCSFISPGRKLELLDVHWTAV